MKLKLAALVGAALFSINAVATEIVHYTNKPVTVHLQNGEERTIQFGDHVAVGVTPEQEVNKLFRVQSAQGAIHLRPNTTFSQERIQVKRITDGKIILMDLVSTEPTDKPLEDMRVYVGNEAQVIRDKQKVTESQVGNSQGLGLVAPREPISPVTLTRYAAQKLYSPERLHKGVPGISEANLNSMVNKKVRAFKGINRARTDVEPVLAYRGDNLYVTALLVRNTTSDSITLNYMDINLPFSHATYQHHKLARKGLPGDRTILYLVNDRPLKETLVPWTFFKDEKARLKAQAKAKPKLQGYHYEGK